MGDRAVDKLRENVLATQVEAALQGHHLGEFRPVDGLSPLGHEAFCAKCTMSVYVSDKTVFSIMPIKCPGDRVYDD